MTYASRLRVLLAAAIGAAGLLVIPASPAAAVVGTEPSSVVLRSTPNPSETAELVTITAVVAGGSGIPAGVVTFYDNGEPIGALPLDDSGSADLPHEFTTAGEHLLTAEYSGDATYAESNAVPHTQTVAASLTRRTWVGASGGTWSNSSNWDPVGLPADGETLVLKGGAMQNDIDGLDLAHISFVETGATVTPASGVTMGLTGTIHNDTTAGSSIQVPLTLTAGQHTIDGDISLGPVSGDGGIVKTGAPDVRLASGTYTGLTEVKAGTLVGNGATALGATSAGTTVSPAATLKLLTGTAEPLTLNGDGASATTGALHVDPAATLTGAVALAGSQVTMTGSPTLSGVVSGPSKLRKTGAGTLVMKAVNTYSGGTDITGGVVSTETAKGLGTGSVSLGAARLNVQKPVTLTNPITTAAGATLSVGPTVFPNSAALVGALTMNGPTTVYADPLGYLWLGGVISGAGSLTKTGHGALYLGGTGANTYSGATTVQEGGLVSRKTPPAVGVPGALSITSSFTADSDNQIADGAAVTVANTGTYAQRGWVDEVGSYASAGVTELGAEELDDTFYGILTTGDLTLSGGTLIARIDGDEAGFSHDQISADGAVALGGNLQIKGEVPPGKTITLIDKTSTGPVTGTFANAAEGAKIGTATVSYVGGDGNDVTLTGPPARSGYWMMGSDGKVYPFGNAKHYGEAAGRTLSGTPVDIEPASDFNGYWVLTTAGEVFAFGSAPFYGSAAGQLQAGEVATSISNDGFDSYWIFTNKGRAIDFGDAGHFNDMSGATLNGPVLGSVATPTGMGYYMVASDGGVFAFGDAKFHGSMGGQPLNGPVVGMAPDPDNAGYWQVANDGGIFAFTANFKGSMGGQPLNRPVVGMVSYGDGYLMVGSDGGIFNFSTKPFHGSLGANPPAHPVVAVAPLNE